MRPVSPRKAPHFGAKLGVLPGQPVVRAHLNPAHPQPARPRLARQRNGAGVHQSRPRHKIRHPRRQHQRANPHLADRLPGIIRRVLVAIRLLHLIARERLGDRLYAGKPLDAGHAIPARNQQPQRIAVLRLQRRAVHLIRQQRLVARNLGKRQAALIKLRLAALHALVAPREHNLDRRAVYARRVKDAFQRRSRPFCRADSLKQPRLAHRTRTQPRPPIARALHHHRHRYARHPLDVVQSQA